MGGSFSILYFLVSEVKHLKQQVSPSQVLSSSVLSPNPQTKLLACLKSALGLLGHPHLPVLTMAVLVLKTKSNSYDTDDKLTTIRISTLTPSLILNFSLNLLYTHVVDLTVSRMNPYFFLIFNF